MENGHGYLAKRKTDGLIADYALGREVQRRLREYYPDQHHANRELWAIWETLG